MAAQLKEYRVRLYDDDDATVVATYTGEVASPPTYGAQIIRPLHARTENNPFDVEIVDANESVTADLYDANGAFRLRGRLADVSERLTNLDTGVQGSWNVTYTGRVLDVEQTRDVLSYNFRITDERFIEREHDVFTKADTTTIVPAYVKSIHDFPEKGGFSHAVDLGRPVDAEIDFAWTGPGNQFADLVRIELNDPARITEEIIQYIEDDVRPGYTPRNINRGAGDGVFMNIRADIDGTEYEIASFDHLHFGKVETIIEDAKERAPKPFIAHFWVVDPNDTLGAEGSDVKVFVHAPTAPPHEIVPLHIGQEEGIHPFQLLKDIYDGEYSEDDVSVRYDTAALDALIDDDSYPNVWFRVTDTYKMSEWLEDNIYKVFRVAPFINDNGEVIPKSVKLPSEDDISIGTLFEFDESNLTTVPTWGAMGADAVTSITFKWPLMFHQSWTHEHAKKSNADRLEIEESRAYVKSHEPASGKGGGREIAIDLLGIRPPNQLFSEATGIPSVAAKVADRIARDIFDLFGDGPQVGSFQALYSTEDPKTEPGEIVQLDLGTHPNGVTGSRGGARLVQILTRTREPGGLRYEYIDLGPNLQPIAAPSVTVSKNSTDPYNTVDISVGSIPSNGVVTVQGSLDGDTWFTIEGDTTETSLSYGRVRSGGDFYVRGRAKVPGRITSGWSTPDTATMDTLSAPTDLTADDDENSVNLTWANPDHPDRRVMPVWDEPGELSNYLNKPLPPNTRRFAINHLVAGGHTLGVKYVDAYGGESPAATDTVTIQTTGQLPEPQKLALIQADQDGIRLPTPDEKYVVGTGIEIQFEPQARYANVEAQVSGDDGFTNPVSDIIPPGVYRHKFLGLPLKDDPTDSGLEDYYVRIRSVKKGYPASEWSSVVSGEATRLLEDAGPDLFAGGYAFLDVLIDGTLQLIAGSSDVDTDAIVYRVNKNPLGSETFPDPDSFDMDEDQVIDDSEFPYEDSAKEPDDDVITVAPGDVVYLTAAFYNDVADAFGQISYDVYRVSTNDFVRAFPILDKDGKDVKLIPRRSERAESIRYAVDESGPPTKATIQSGPVSTDDEITVHTFEKHGEEVWVGMFAYENDDGTGIERGVGGGIDPFILKAEYSNVNEIPQLIYHVVQPKSQGNERFRLTAWDDSAQVGLKWRVFEDGSHPGDDVWDEDTGLLADPVEEDVSVGRPSVGDANQILEAVAYDSAGNQSHPNTEPLRIIVDPNKIPSGDLSLDVDDETGKVYVTVGNVDGDAGSYRFKVNQGAAGSVTFVNPDFSDTDEFSGTDFGTRNYLGSSYDLGNGEAIAVSMQLFRTTDTVAGSQSGSIASGIYRDVYSFHNAEFNPKIISYPTTAVNEGEEAYRIVAWDDGAQVGLKRREYTEGDAVPSYTDLGLFSVPTEQKRSVDVPDEGDNPTIMEWVAYDEEGNQSHTDDDPYRIVIDSDKVPSLSGISVDVDNETGDVYVAVERVDSDTGSYRLKYATGGVDADAFEDVDFTGTNEIAGSNFGTSQKISGVNLSVGETIFVSVRGFRTTSTVANDQDNSTGSFRHLRAQDTRSSNAPPVRITWKKGTPTGNNAEGKEVVEFTITPTRPPSTEVAFWYAVNNEGDGEPSWGPGSHRHTDDDGVVESSGYASGSLRVRVEVDRPTPSKEGGTRKALWFRGELNGNDGVVFSDASALYVDADKDPVGEFKFNQPRTANDNVFITPTSDDPDTGSWRFRVNLVTIGGGDEDDYLSPAFSDVSSDEFSGNTFGAPVDCGATHQIPQGKKLNVAGMFFGTTSASASTQQNSSLRSSELQFDILSRGEDYYDIEVPNGVQITGPFKVEIKAEAFINGDSSSATLSYRESNTSGGMDAWQDAPLNPDTIEFNRGTRNNFGGGPNEEKVVEFAVNQGGTRYGERQIVIPPGEITAIYRTRSLTATDATIEDAEILAGGVSLADGSLAWSDDAGQNWTTMATNPDDITVSRPANGSDPTEVVLGYDDGNSVTSLGTFIDIPAQTS